MIKHKLFIGLISVGFLLGITKSGIALRPLRLEEQTYTSPAIEEICKEFDITYYEFHCLIMEQEFKGRTEEFHRELEQLSVEGNLCISVCPECGRFVKAVKNSHAEPLLSSAICPYCWPKWWAQTKKKLPVENNERLQWKIKLDKTIQDFVNTSP